MKVEYTYFVCQNCNFTGGSSDFSNIIESDNDFDTDFHCPICHSNNIKKRIGITEVNVPSLKIEKLIRKSQKIKSVVQK